jgi:predicted acylesterase/phospholipase RssA
MTRRLKEFLADPNRKRRILALDGGGVRGLMTLGVLSQLEAELSRRSGDPDYRLSQYFDLIGGTSTGSIIATGLAHGWRVSRVQRAYRDIVPKIFKRVVAWGLFAPKYREKPLVDALTEFFDETTLESPELETGLAIFAKRMNSGSAWVFCNNPGWNYYDNEKPGPGHAPNCKFKLRSLVQASAAAPHYFRGVEMEIMTSQPGVPAEPPAYFIDGGVGGFNNPALELLTVVRDPAYGFNWPLGADNLYMLSIGTGWVRELTRPGGVFFLQTVGALRAMINDVSLQQIAYMQALGRPQMPWYINGEKKQQAGRAYLAPNDAPTLTYQRVDVRFEDEKAAGALLPDTAHALRDKKLKKSEFKGLRDIANSKRRNSELLAELGERAGARLIQSAPPPAIFDPPTWTRSGAEGPGSRRNA